MWIMKSAVTAIFIYMLLFSFGLGFLFKPTYFIYLLSNKKILKMALNRIYYDFQ